MKTKKYYLILAVATAILYAPAPGEIKLPLPEDSRPVLIARPHPQLAGIRELYVRIMRVGTGPSKDALVWKDLRAKVEHKLVKAGIRMYSGTVRDWPTTPATPVLQVDTDMLRLKDSQQYVFRIQTSLVRTVTLPAQPNLHLHADVWKKGSPMQAISVKNMPAKVTGVVLEQVDAFIHAYSIANPPGTRPPDANDITGKPEKLTKPDEKRIAAEYKYVASKNSKVFHKPECRWAKRIKPANLVGYNSREEVIEAGKRPCKMCKP